MKKILALLLLLTLSLFAVPLRLGIISDTQPHAAKLGPGSPFQDMKKAFNMMKKMGVDAVLIAGDLASHNDKDIYDEFRAIYDEVFGTENPPVFLPVMGNHDFWGILRGPKAAKDKYGRTPKVMAQRIDTFKKHLKIDAIDHHRVLKGIDIIGCSLTGGLSPSPENIAFMEGAIKKAIERDATKPIIVYAHNTARNTLYGGKTGDQKLQDLFKKYPQVVYFSGHTHFTLEDESSIHQEDFTSIGTSTVNYTSCGYSSLEYPIRRNLGRNMLYVTVGDKELIARRFQLRDESEILYNGKPWTLQLPLSKETFTYTNEYRKKNNPFNVPPTWPENATLSAAPFPKGKPFQGVELKGTAATHPHLVKGYFLNIFRKEGDQWVKETNFIHNHPYRKLIPAKGPLKFWGDFYVGLNFRRKDFTVKVKVSPVRKYNGFDFQPNTTYRLDVVPFDNFDNVGTKTLSCQVTMPAEKAGKPGNAK